MKAHKVPDTTLHDSISFCRNARVDSTHSGTYCAYQVCTVYPVIFGISWSASLSPQLVSMPKKCFYFCFLHLYEIKPLDIIATVPRVVCKWYLLIFYYFCLENVFKMITAKIDTRWFLKGWNLLVYFIGSRESRAFTTPLRIALHIYYEQRNKFFIYFFLLHIFLIWV